MNIERLVEKARAGNLGHDEPDYQTLLSRSRQAGRMGQEARNALGRIDDAGGARRDVSVNKVI